MSRHGWDGDKGEAFGAPEAPDLPVENPIAYLVPGRLDPVLSLKFDSQIGDQGSTGYNGYCLSGKGAGDGGGIGGPVFWNCDAVTVCVVCSGVVFR